MARVTKQRKLGFIEMCQTINSWWSIFKRQVDKQKQTESDKLWAVINHNLSHMLTACHGKLQRSWKKKGQICKFEFSA